MKQRLFTPRSSQKMESIRSWFISSDLLKMGLILHDVSFHPIDGSIIMDIQSRKLPFLSSCCRATPISSINTLRREAYTLPSLFTVSGYKVFFWANENNEPVHVHVSKGKPSPNATKIWLTRKGGCILASNGSNIPRKELSELMEFISAQFFLICNEWKKFFVTNDLSFYC